jgi:anti-sigma regulatory factor (Ser/Thr protein kinase)
MSISPLRSPSWVADPWEALVAHEVRRQGDIEAAFDRADASERRPIPGVPRAASSSGPAAGEGSLLTDPSGFALRLAGGPEACLAARRAVVACDGQVPAAVRDDVLLLVTELVANAVRHGGVGPDQSLRIELRRRPRSVRVEVVDPGGHVARVRPRPITDDPGGWGLVLVERIASRWGVGHGAPGTCVWFEMEVGH